MVEWRGKDNREYGIDHREEIMEFRFYVFTNLMTVENLALMQPL